MNYELVNSSEKDISTLIKYKLETILEYVVDLDDKEKEKINNYVEKNVPLDLKNYQNIIIDNKMIGCILVKNNKNDLFLDEIYIEKDHRNNGIGTTIIKNILKQNKNTYLWVYKLNINAVNLYKKLGFEIIEETDSRYYMKYSVN